MSDKLLADGIANWIEAERWKRLAWFMARGWWGLAAREVEIMRKEGIERCTAHIAVGN